MEAAATTATAAADNGGSSKRSVALKATANEISNMLMPKKVRKVDVMRITLRKRDNVLLEQILMDRDGDEEDDDDDDGGVNFDDDNEENNIITQGRGAKEKRLPTRMWPKLTTRQQSDLLSPLSNANARIFHNFIHLSKRLSLLTTRERLRLLDYIVERVYLLVCIPETSRIARNIVMSQGRKGMDNEPVDDFKVAIHIYLFICLCGGGLIFFLCNLSGTLTHYFYISPLLMIRV